MAIIDRLKILAVSQDDKCFACGKIFRSNKTKHLVNVAHEDQDVFVGPECYKRISAAGKTGWQPIKKGKAFGPRLYLMQFKTK
jgi:hypothetical protein